MGWIDSLQRNLANAMSCGVFLLTDVAHGPGRWRESRGAEHSSGLVVGFGQASCVSRFGGGEHIQDAPQSRGRDSADTKLAPTRTAARGLTAKARPCTPPPTRASFRRAYSPAPSLSC